MKILDVDQRSEEWLEARQTVITGTRVKDIKPPMRKVKTGSQTMGLWQLVAEYVSYGAEEESPMVRGTHLENENAEKVVEKVGLENPLYECGMWLSDDGKLGYSPDACENSDVPTWAIECKSLSTAEHLFLVMKDMFALGLLPDEMEPLFPAGRGAYRGIDSVAEEHQHQVRQAFVVNPKLEKLYYSLYDPRILETDSLGLLRHYVIVVTREEMEEDIAGQAQMVETQANLARSIVKVMMSLQKLVEAQAKRNKK